MNSAFLPCFLYLGESKMGFGNKKGPSGRLPFSVCSMASPASPPPFAGDLSDLLKATRHSRKRIRSNLYEKGPWNRPVLSSFKPKQKVEVRIKDKGFEGSWYEARVVARKRKHFYRVVYDSLAKESDESSALEEFVAAYQLRPRPPSSHRHLNFGVGHIVDAYYNDGWWVGTVAELPESDGVERYKLHFSGCREDMVFELSKLRPHLDWVDGKWTKPKMQTNFRRSLKHIEEKAEKRKQQLSSTSHKSKVPRTIRTLNHDDTGGLSKLCVHDTDPEIRGKNGTCQSKLESFTDGKKSDEIEYHPVSIDYLVGYEGSSGSPTPTTLLSLEKRSVFHLQTYLRDKFRLSKCPSNEKSTKNSNILTETPLEPLLKTIPVDQLVRWNESSNRREDSSVPGSEISNNQSTITNVASSIIHDTENFLRTVDQGHSAGGCGTTVRDLLQQGETSHYGDVGSLTRLKRRKKGVPVKVRITEALSEGKESKGFYGKNDAKIDISKYILEEIGTSHVIDSHSTSHDIQSLYHRRSNCEGFPSLLNCKGDSPADQQGKKPVGESSNGVHLAFPTEAATQGGTSTKNMNCAFSKRVTGSHFSCLSSVRSLNTATESPSKSLVGVVRKCPLMLAKLNQDFVLQTPLSRKEVSNREEESSILNVERYEHLSTRNNFGSSINHGTERFRGSIEFCHPEGVSRDQLQQGKVPCADDLRTYTSGKKRKKNSTEGRNKKRNASSEGNEVKQLNDKNSMRNEIEHTKEVVGKLPCRHNMGINHEDHSSILNHEGGSVGDKKDTGSHIEAATQGGTCMRNSAGVLSNMMASSTNSVLPGFSDSQHNGVGKAVQNESLLPTSGFQEALTNTLADKSSSEMPCLPFEKRSSIWRFLESSEVLSKFPQKPHFRPLGEFNEGLREGMAIGLMVNYSNLVSSVRDLKIDDSLSKIVDNIKTLAHLEEHGFVVHHVRACFDELLRVKSYHEQLAQKSFSMKERLLEKEKEKGRLVSEAEANEQTVKALTLALAHSIKKRKFILRCKEETDSGALELQKDIRAIEEVIQTTQHDFEGILTVPW